ncbi:MAG: UpxY family transcription antiterminator [Candidatus Solibacter sp.]
MQTEPVWFALTVKPRHEKVANQNLLLRGLEAFLPSHQVRRTWSDRIQTVELPLFPGYVFSRFTYEDRMRALNTPGVRSIVTFAGVGAPIEACEIRALQAIVSSGLPISPWPYLRAGEKVRIERGSLEGLCGTLVREKSSWRIVVSVELLQRSVAVEVDRELVVPLHGDSTRPACLRQSN